MNIHIRFPFAIVRTNQAEEIRKAKSEMLSAMKEERRSFEVEVRKAIHGAYAGIVCASCGKNVFRGEKDNNWVHGNGGKAYCLNPCWKELNNGTN